MFNPYIIHITGPQCSGKTTLIKEIIQKYDLPYWDIQEWYKKNKIIEDNEINWNLFFEMIHLSWKEFVLFITKCSSNIIILETSGTNKLFNEKLDEFQNISIIKLKIPFLNEFKKRIKKRELNEKEVIEFTKKRFSEELFLSEALTEEEAWLYTDALIQYINKTKNKL